jgi:uroporphyrinogen decarboxylase
MIRLRKYAADFQQLEKVLCLEKPDRPVLFEYFINGELISYVNDQSFSAIDKPVDQIKSIIQFFHRSGYDYATIPARYFGAFSFETVVHEKKATVSLNEGSLIQDRKSFDLYPWPNPETGNFDLLHQSTSELMDGMKFIVAGPGGLLENVINLVGFEQLCFMIYEDEELIKAIFEEVGSRLLRFYEITSSLESVGALIVNDDWGFKTQTMISPETLRQLVFPWHKKMVDAIHGNGKYAILHSCGNLTDVMDDVIDKMRYDAKHSFEDLILPVEKAWESYHQRIAILGGIDMDFLVRSSTDAIKSRSVKMLKSTSCEGYALGSGNSIPIYVPIENYLAMIEAVNE